MLQLNDVSKSFDDGATHAVQGVSLRIEQGETLALLGASGCGKTTTLKMINRLVEPSAGRIEIDGSDASSMDLRELRRSIGYVFQDIGLFPHMNVEENAGISLRLHGIRPGDRRRRVCELLETLGLEPHETLRRRPAQLSGGQRQRIGIARALANDPALLLMDEPFGALDAVTRDQLQLEFLRLKETLHKTILFVTHDLFEAIRLGDRIGVMNNGRLEQVGPPDELRANPATLFVASLFEQAERAVGILNGEDA